MVNYDLPEYQIIRSSRKTIAIQILPNGQVVVRCPRRMGKAAIQTFVQNKSNWILRHLPDTENREPPFTKQEMDQLRQRAKVLTADRTAHYAAILGVNYEKITIRAQRTRWGSCSGAGNLNFNCLLALVPERVLDYVVVHELCHRKHMNHSPAFWAEVERVLPDYRNQKTWLRENGGALIARLPETGV